MTYRKYSVIYLCIHCILKYRRCLSGIFHKRGHTAIVLLRALYRDFQSSIYSIIAVLMPIQLWDRTSKRYKRNEEVRRIQQG